MNRKYSCFILLLNLILLSGIIGSVLYPERTPSLMDRLSEKRREQQDVVRTSYQKNDFEIEMQSIGVQHQLDVQYLEREKKYELSEEDYDILLRIVQAEAGSEDNTGKILVANVILNRVNSEDFPDSVKDVVYQKEQGVWQFSPVPNGSINKVEVSEDTILAVDCALYGEDYSEGALYFASRKYASPEKMKWFDRHLTSLFTHGGHEFFK